MKLIGKTSLMLVLAMVFMEGCSGSNGKNGATGATGATGPQGPTDPTISWVMPVQGASDVYTDAVIKVGFAKPMDSSTINASTFSVSTSGTAITGTISYDAGSQTAFFDPNVPLSQFGYYTATLTTGIKDTSGNPIPATYTWSFMTGGSSTPMNLYISDYSNEILVFDNAGSAQGNMFPDRNISGSNTLLSGPEGIWLDKATDRLYVANQQANSIDIFENAGTANGNIAPLRTISGASTGLSLPSGLWYDSASDTLYVSNQVGNSIEAFADVSTLNGNVAPSRTISGSNTTLQDPISLWYDATSDELYVASVNNASIDIFDHASTLSGNIAPSRTISGSSTTFVNPIALWLDNASDQLYVADYSNDSVDVFDNASTAHGNIAPSRILAGTNTTLSGLWTIWLDASNNRLYVSNSGGPSVLVFDGADTLNGNVAPSRTIAGANTAFTSPIGLWLDMNP